MNKKANTLLFIVGATVFNIIITFVFIVLLAFIYVKTLMPMLPEEGRSWGFPVIFIAAIAISFLVYRLVLKLFMKKINMEQYFDPIFGRRRR